MKRLTLFPWKRFHRHTEGAVSVEFGLVLSMLLLIAGGVVDFGHYLYLRQVATTASREGARFGSMYSEPRVTSEAISTFIKQKFGPSLGSSDGSGLVVTVTGAGGASGTDLTVTVTGNKNWFLLDSFINSLANPEVLRHPTGVTVMKLE